MSTRCPRVRAVVVNYNGAEMTRSCVADLRQQSYRPLDIVVVDAFSGESDWQELLAQVPSEVVLIRMEGTSGYSQCLNRGCAEREGLLEADLILAMNNDLVLPGRDTVAVLVAAFGVNAKLAAVSPLVRDVRSGVPPTWDTQGRRLPSFFGLLVVHSWWLRRLPWLVRYWVQYVYAERIPFQPPVPERCELINGAVFMVHGDFLKAIGGFDEGAFMYHEELVLGHQVRQAGRECAVITATEVHHLQGHATGYTSKAFSVRFCREQARGEAYYVRRCLRGNFLLVTLLYAVRAVDAVSKLALFGLGLRGRRTARPARRPVRAGL